MKTTLKVIGRSKLEDGDTVPCDHCRREIKNLVHLDNGQTVGTSCALNKLGYTRAVVDGAPLVHPDMETLAARCGGFSGHVMVDGQIRLATRGYVKGGGFTPWVCA